MIYGRFRFAVQLHFAIPVDASDGYSLMGSSPTACRGDLSRTPPTRPFHVPDSSGCFIAGSCRSRTAETGIVSAGVPWPQGACARMRMSNFDNVARKFPGKSAAVPGKRRPRGSGRAPLTDCDKRLSGSPADTTFFNGGALSPGKKRLCLRLIKWSTSSPRPRGSHGRMTGRFVGKGARISVAPLHTSLSNSMTVNRTHAR